MRNSRASDCARVGYPGSDAILDIPKSRIAARLCRLDSCCGGDVVAGDWIDLNVASDREGGI